MSRLSYICVMTLLAACGEPTPYLVFSDTIPEPLSAETPNAEMGAELFAAREGAHCILCHKHDRVSDGFQGDLGPDLSNIRNRLSTGQLRLRIVDYDTVKPGTAMPSYYRTRNLYEVDPEHSGQTVLSDLEIEDIIAFLMVDENDSQE